MKNVTDIVNFCKLFTNFRKKLPKRFNLVKKLKKNYLLANILTGIFKMFGNFFANFFSCQRFLEIDVTLLIKNSQSFFDMTNSPSPRVI